MNRLKGKLRSEDGASLLLSLLVFLLCVLVAATVLAAAVSNAGRVRSNRAEQQRYQTLSSAMRLICGELEKTEYTGKYKYYTWTDVDDSVEYYYCEQQSGKIVMQTAYNAQAFQLTGFPFMEADGSLTKEMDDVFRKSFLDDSGVEKTGYKALEESEVTTASTPVYLKVTLPVNLPGYPYATGGSTALKKYEIPKTVNVKIELEDHNPRNIKLKLTAWLDDTSGTSPASGSGIMNAELKAEVKEKTAAGVLEKYDVLEPHLPNSPLSPGTLPASGMTEEEKTVSVTWKLDNIRMTTAP